MTTPAPDHPWRVRKRTHGHYDEPEYTVWYTMLKEARKRNVDIFPAWRESYDNFRRDMGSRPNNCRFKRKDTGKGFLPENCHWLARSGRRSRRLRWV